MSARILQGLKLDSVPNITLGQFFFESAQKFQHGICHINANTNQEETFSTLSQRSVRVALSMIERGVTFEDVIVTCSEITLDTPVALLASFYLGAKVGNLDPSLSIRQTSHLLSLVSPKMIFVEESAIDLIETSLNEAKLDSEIVVLGSSKKYTTLSDFETVKPNEELFRPVLVDTNETIIMLFSSGTTGLPKAICHTHQSFLNIVFSFYHSTDKIDTVMYFTSFYWISGLMFFTCPYITGGRRIVCGSTVKAQQVFDCIEKYKVTFTFMAPVLTYHLTNFEQDRKYDVSSLFAFYTGGTALSTTQFRKLFSIFEYTNFASLYGMSEVGVSNAFDLKTNKNLIKQKINSCGKIMQGFSLKIVDLETGKTLGPNQKGEIHIKTCCVMKGYHKEDSTKNFDSDGFFKTGDVGYYDDDECLYMIERLKEIFKYMSWHVVPSAIEFVLLEHPSVREAVVFGLPVNEEVGEVPAACVVLKEGAAVSEQEIEDFVACRVSDRERLRGGVYFVEELFRTATGKLMRKQNRDYIIDLLNKK